MSDESNVVVSETLYQQLIEEVKKYIPEAYIATTEEINSILGIENLGV